MAKKRKKPEIPPEAVVDQPKMTPFIDIVFQLLIFFMLTMKFIKEEGHILQQLPKDKGLQASAATIEPKEVRIYVCADIDQKFEGHVDAKISHPQRVERMKVDEKKPVGNICYIWLQLEYRQKKVYSMFRTKDDKSKKQHNRDVYRSMCENAIQIQETLKATATRTPPIIIDADGQVPYEHVFGLISYLSAKGIKQVELAGNRKFQ
ncbi:MAG: biopolymer transporter ExbD [Planctomycetes bacterium]|nr:biopolymer transporter ExbD [Planctomycetota bacterium]